MLAGVNAGIPNLKRTDYNSFVPRACTICTHAERDGIERSLLAQQQSLRNLAQRYETSPTALWRHKRDHLPAAVVKANEAEEVLRADGLLEEVRSLCKRTLGLFGEAESILKEAREAKDLRTALAAIHTAARTGGEVRENLKLLGRLTNQLEGEKPQVVVLTLEQQNLMQETEQEVIRRGLGERQEPIDVTPEAEPSSALATL